MKRLSDREILGICWLLIALLLVWNLCTYRQLPQEDYEAMLSLSALPEQSLREQRYHWQDIQVIQAFPRHYANFQRLQAAVAAEQVLNLGYGNRFSLSQPLFTTDLLESDERFPCSFIIVDKTQESNTAPWQCRLALQFQCRKPLPGKSHSISLWHSGYSLKALYTYLRYEAVGAPGDYVERLVPNLPHNGWDQYTIPSVLHEIWLEGRRYRLESGCYWVDLQAYTHGEGVRLDDNFYARFVTTTLWGEEQTLTNLYIHS